MTILSGGKGRPPARPAVPWKGFSARAVGGLTPAKAAETTSFASAHSPEPFLSPSPPLHKKIPTGLAARGDFFFCYLSFSSGDNPVRGKGRPPTQPAGPWRGFPPGRWGVSHRQSWRKPLLLSRLTAPNPSRPLLLPYTKKSPQAWQPAGTFSSVTSLFHPATIPSGEKGGRQCGQLVHGRVSRPGGGGDSHTGKGGGRRRLFARQTDHSPELLRSPPHRKRCPPFPLINHSRGPICGPREWFLSSLFFTLRRSCLGEEGGRQCGQLVYEEVFRPSGWANPRTGKGGGRRRLFARQTDHSPELPRSPPHRKRCPPFPLIKHSRGPTCGPRERFLSSLFFTLRRSRLGEEDGR